MRRIITPFVFLAASSALLAVATTARASEYGGGFGLGISTTFTPFAGIPGGAAGLGTTDIGARIWATDAFAVEPVLGLGLTSGNGTVFGMDAGVHLGYALANGNLRPIVGGALMFGFLVGSGIRDPLVSLRFGPELGIEYFFSELHKLSLEASLWLPFSLVFPGGGRDALFSMLTQGSVLAGFHYYF